MIHDSRRTEVHHITRTPGTDSGAWTFAPSRLLASLASATAHAPNARKRLIGPDINYGLYEVTEAPEDNWAKTGDLLILADALAESVFKQARVTAYTKLRDLPADTLDAVECAHPLKGFEGGYEFIVPLLAGDHVTDDTGTGFVHTAPGHGREDFDVWTANARELEPRGINTTIPYTVDENGAFTDHAPGFVGKRVINDKGEKGDANEAVIKALVERGMLLARGRLKHQYPHSWRSKKPVIFRNTPQWFVHMDKELGDGTTLRSRALARDHPVGAACDHAVDPVLAGGRHPLRHRDRA